jgi:hypothetical protein
MASITPVRLTKPKISALVLEGTLAAVSVILVAWLMLWFIRQTAVNERILAFQVDPELNSAPTREIFPQTPDIRAFQGKSASAADTQALIDKAVKSAQTPLVIYVSAPALGFGKDAKIGDSLTVGDLIQSVVTNAKRHVLLALDLAQVDSDRDLGVFGNSPYSGLEEFVATLENSNRKHVTILTSSAPGQKSFWSDELGRSVFAHFLREELAAGSDGANSAEINDLKLCESVSRQVRLWVKENRRSVQTPLRMTAGGKDVAFTLRRMRPNKASAKSPAELEALIGQSAVGKIAAKVDSGSPEAKPKEEVAAPAAAPPAPAALRPREALAVDLIKEWDEHHKLRQSGGKSGNRWLYRTKPVTWREYQSILLRAERLLRAAWHDEADSDLEQSRRLLLEATRIRGSIGAGPPADDGYFRSTDNDLDAKRQIKEAVDYLTRNRSTQPPPDPQGKPDAAKGAVAPGDNQAPAKPAPQLLGDISQDGYPRPFLELQLLAWANRFNSEFLCPEYFLSSPRKDLLPRLVEVRAKVETALGTDHRGLAWIRPLVERGDDRRRWAQDQLFGLSAGESPMALKLRSECDHVNTTEYERALQLIKQFATARDSWEQAAAELPYLAEWAIIRQSFDLAKQSADPIPTVVRDALGDALRLSLVLYSRPPADSVAKANREDDDKLDDRWSADSTALREAIVALDRSLGYLRDEFEREANPTRAASSWLDFDNLLRVPLIDPVWRKELLRAEFKRSENLLAPAPSQLSSEEKSVPVDRGFFSRAAGLAELDLRLRRMGMGELSDSDPTLELLKTAVSAMGSSGGGSENALTAFDQATKKIAIARGDTRNALEASRVRGSSRKFVDVERTLLKQDCIARILTYGEDSIVSDREAVDYLALADCAMLEFQLERLLKDYVTDFDTIVREINVKRKALTIGELPSPSPALQPLTFNFDPETSKISETGTTDVFAVVATDPASPERPLRGDAFVGVVKTTLPLEVKDVEASTADPPGGLIHLPTDPNKNRKFHITQSSSIDDSGNLQLSGKVFFRGRTNLAGSANVAITPNARLLPIRVQIWQDEDKLNALYPGWAIEDQFEYRRSKGENRENGETGYLHKGKSLNYVLKVKNFTEKPMNLVCSRFLGDGTAAAQAADPNPVAVRQLKPNETRVFDKGTITWADVATRPKVLRVKVTDSVTNKDVIKPYDVTFRPEALDDYIKIEPKFQQFEHEGAVQPCFMVYVSRKETDGVREPIYPKDVVWHIGKLETNAVRGDYQWLVPGQDPVKFHYPATNARQAMTWWVEVGEEKTAPQQVPQ